MSGKAARESKAFKAKYGKRWRIQRAHLRFARSVRRLWVETARRDTQLGEILAKHFANTPPSSRTVTFPIELR